MRRLREWLALTLIAVLPLHAFLVTVGTRVLSGPGNPPMGALALWKEALLGLLLLLALVESWRRWRKPALDALDRLAIAFIAVGIIVSLGEVGEIGPGFVYGLRYDVAPLVAFLVLRRVEWSQAFRKRGAQILLGVGIAVAAYGLLTLLLSERFFLSLGYSDLHSLYLPGKPIAAFQYVGGLGLARIQSTFSGPNQLGLWLLLPWTIVVAKALYGPRRPVHIVSLFVVGLALLFTFSRSAWIAAFAIAAWMYVLMLHPKVRWTVVQFLLVIVLLVAGTAAFVFPDLILRHASSKDHVARPLEAINVMVENPVGLGFGSAGPASNRISDPCVFLPEGSDAAWAADRPELCVFVGESKVQPVDRECACPFLPENWYLQLGVETGVFGMALFLALAFGILRRLWRMKSDCLLDGVAFGAFLGVSIAGLFLHAWEDSAVAYTTWLLLAVAIGHSKPKTGSA